MSYHNSHLDKPEDKSKDLDKFLDMYKTRLYPNQIELIEHFREKIYGFELVGYGQFPPTIGMNPKNRAVFQFIHLGVRGEITIEF